mgnify:CR=1 FL=1
MPETLIKVDLSKPAPSNEMVHNRWHPDIPMACWVNPGDVVLLKASRSTRLERVGEVIRSGTGAGARLNPLAGQMN